MWKGTRSGARFRRVLREGAGDGARHFTVAPRSLELCGCEKNLSYYVNWIRMKNAIVRENRIDAEAENSKMLLL